MAIPALLATSAIHQHLVERGLRTSTGLVVETGSAREVHHFALLAGYGAEAIHPYLAMETLAEMAKGLPGDLSPEKVIKNFVKAIGKGLQKVMSKMGISTYMSYTGSQIFEAIGLNNELINQYFKGTSSNVGGIGVFEVAEEALRLHHAAFSNDPVLADMLDAGVSMPSAFGVKNICGPRTRLQSYSMRHAVAPRKAIRPTKSMPISSMIKVNT